MSKILHVGDHNYPNLLKQINDPPPTLYYLGEFMPEKFKYSLAVVGSRNATYYGKHTVRRLVTGVAKAGVTIISGIARGVDENAHNITMEAGGVTVAVVPGGLTELRGNKRDLARRIVDCGGLIISEHPPMTEVLFWMFPKRNRIIAGLAQATLVIEASKESGSLITAGFAQKYNRRIMAVPGPIDSANSEGTLSLLEKGALLVRRSEDVLRFFGLEKNNPERSLSKPPLKDPIMRELIREPKSMDGLSESLGISPEELAVRITNLLLSGAISEETGIFYVN